MATTPTVLPATGRDVGTGQVLTLPQSQPAQLALFGDFLPPGARDSDANTSELYDAIPKYFLNQQRMAERREGGNCLQSLKRRFWHRDRSYELTIQPARLIDQNGHEKAYYPSYQEALVEGALKTIAADRLNGVFLNETAGVQFTLYDLDQELKRQGYAMKGPDLVLALKICRGAGIDITGPDGQVEVASSIFPVVALANRTAWENNLKGMRCYVQFNPLATYAINKLTCQPCNDAVSMKRKNHLVRWMCKPLSQYRRRQPLVSEWGTWADVIAGQIGAGDTSEP